MNQYLFKIFFFSIINFNLLIYILFTNQYNLPDGVLHELTFNSVYSDKLPNSLINYFKNIDMFSLSIIKQILEGLSPNFISNCTVDYANSLLLTDNCNNIYEYNNKFSFGGDEDLFIYSNSFELNYLKLSLIIYLFILNLITFTIVSIINDKKIFISTLLFLFFPSVLNTISYLSPNIISTYFQIFLFIFFISKYYTIYFILSFFLFFIDFQNISNLILILSFLFIYLLDNTLKTKINYFRLLFFLVSIAIITILLKEYNFFYFLTKSFSTSSFQNYLYLNFGTNDIFKSIFIFFISLYYVGGSMSHFPFLLEYIIFFILLIVFIYLNLFSSKNLFSNIYSDISFTYFIFGLFSFLTLIIIFTSFNQGRYGLLLLFPMFYYYSGIINNHRYLIYPIFGFTLFFNNLKILQNIF